MRAITTAPTCDREHVTIPSSLSDRLALMAPSNGCSPWHCS